jgi:hypothetical protein
MTCIKDVNEDKKELKEKNEKEFGKKSDKECCKESDKQCGKDNGLKDKIYDLCLDFIKKDEVKKELKNLFKPIISLILEEIYPYVYLSLLLVVISFFLVLGIFIMLIKSYK